MRIDDLATAADALCDLGRRFGERGWCLATGGNFSLRLDDSRCLITRSGRDKSRLSRDDLMTCDLDGRPDDPSSRPSAETPLHTLIYRLDPAVGAVLHTHSVFSTLLSRGERAAVSFRGYEMQKALDGVRSHDETVRLAVFDNDQDMPALAGTIAEAWRDGRIGVPAFLVAGHGLYAWGRDLDAAIRHAEGVEFLLECRWREAAGTAG